MPSVFVESNPKSLNFEEKKNYAVNFEKKYMRPPMRYKERKYHSSKYLYANTEVVAIFNPRYVQLDPNLQQANHFDEFERLGFHTSQHGNESLRRKHREISLLQHKHERA